MTPAREERELLEVLDLLEEWELLREWDPEADLPIPIEGAETPADGTREERP